MTSHENGPSLDDFEKRPSSLDESTRRSRDITRREDAERDAKTCRLRDERMFEDARRHDRDIASLREFAFSSNGDRWFLGSDERGVAFVLHRANMPSGGHETRMPVQTFMDSKPAGPEHDALREIVDFRHPENGAARTMAPPDSASNQHNTNERRASCLPAPRQDISHPTT